MAVITLKDIPEDDSLNKWLERFVAQLAALTEAVNRLRHDIDEVLEGLEEEDLE